MSIVNQHRLGRIAELPRASLMTDETVIESMPNLASHCGGARLLVKRDDCTGLALGGNKVRQLDFYLGAARSEDADTVLITGAVQSNFVRQAAAAARKLGMDCHIQLEERVAKDDPDYYESGNVFIDRLLGATIHRYSEGEDEAGADRQLDDIAAKLQAAGQRPYIIHLGPRHPPLGALGYVVAAQEILGQIDAGSLNVDRIFVGSGSGATHGGLLFGLRALGSDIPVTGVCVRRSAELQQTRIRNTCDELATLLHVDPPVSNEDISLTDAFLGSGYGIPNDETLNAIVLGARKEGLLVDPVYTGKVLAAVIHQAQTASKNSTFLFLHTGGSPALFAYRKTIAAAIADADQL